MTAPDDSTSEVIRKVYAYAEKQLASGASAQGLRDTLLSKGVPNEIIDSVLATLTKPKAALPTKLEVRRPWAGYGAVLLGMSLVAGAIGGPVTSLGGVLVVGAICLLSFGVLDQFWLGRKKQPPATATVRKLRVAVACLLFGSLGIRTLMLSLAAANSAADEQARTQLHQYLKPAAAGAGEYRKVDGTQIWVPDQWTLVKEADKPEARVLGLSSPTGDMRLTIFIYNREKDAYAEIEPAKAVGEIVDRARTSWKDYACGESRTVKFHDGYRACSARMQGRPLGDSPLIDQVHMVATDDAGMYHVVIAGYISLMQGVSDSVIEDIFRWVQPPANQRAE